MLISPPYHKGAMPGTPRAEIRTLKIGRYVAIEEDAYKILSMS